MLLQRGTTKVLGRLRAFGFGWSERLSAVLLLLRIHEACRRLSVVLQH